MTSDQTRDSLLRAGAELIGELGWSAVTTRAVAQRAGVPHGAVSYHFSGKQDLLRRAALALVEATFAGLIAILDEGQQTVPVHVSAAATQLRAVDSSQSDEDITSLAECLVHACRDEQLADEFRTWLRRYRDSLADRARTDDTLRPDADAGELAMLVAAVLDGLWLHLTVDPELDIEAACRLLARLLTRRSGA